MVIIVNLIMKKRKKKNNNQNTDKLVTEDSLTNTNNFTNTNKLANNQIAPTDSLRNYTGRPWPMTPKAGVTLQPRRYQFGGNYGR